MRSLLVLFILTAILHNGMALQCFQCLGSLTSDCFNGVAASMIPAECDPTQRSPANLPFPGLPRDAEEPEIVTTCVSFIHNNFMGMTFIERGCGWIYRDVDICDYMREVQNLDLAACSWCDTPFCNTDLLTK